VKLGERALPPVGGFEIIDNQTFVIRVWVELSSYFFIFKLVGQGLALALPAYFFTFFKTKFDMRTKLIFMLAVFSMSSLFFVACGNDGTKTEGSEATAADTTATQAAPAPAEIKLTPFSSSPDFPDAKVSFTYAKGRFAFNVQNYELKAQTSDAPQKMCANSKDGQHIHLIVDNEPYDAVYETGFEKAVPDGNHFILAFPSRSYHESIKSKGAAMAVRADIKGGSLGKNTPVKEPVLFYSRPKGKYVGKAETEKVMLDFYLVNTELSPDGNKVKVLINGEKEFTLDKWEPVFIEGLPMGDNKVQLTLIDKDGAPVNAPMNPVERVFTLMDDPAPGN
jgi:hypothetical protein